MAAVEGSGGDDDGERGRVQQRLCFCCSCCYHRFLSLASSPTLPLQLFKDGVLQTEMGDKDNPRLSKMRKEVVAGGKDTMEVDNEFFLVPVKISDHQWRWAVEEGIRVGGGSRLLVLRVVAAAAAARETAAAAARGGRGPAAAPARGGTCCDAGARICCGGGDGPWREGIRAGGGSRLLLLRVAAAAGGGCSCSYAWRRRWWEGGCGCLSASLNFFDMNLLLDLAISVYMLP
uniref:Uncharacterized protein n=1 Tax=Oryza glumipatula TaxID=40148 RepID=A0A0E0BJC8_9ORYZ